jgi:acyl dehydratase
MTVTNIPLKIGDELPEIIHSCDILQSAIFADTTGNYHRIHWDQEYARSEGLSYAVVNSGFLMAWLEANIENTYGPAITWKKMDIKFKEPVPIDIKVSSGGAVTDARSEHEDRLTLEIDISIRGLDGSVYVAGHAVIEVAQ